MEPTTDQKRAIAESARSSTRRSSSASECSGPLTEGHRYDLVFDLDGRLARAQCKWATLHGRRCSDRCYSCRRTRSGQLRRGYSAEGRCDCGVLRRGRPMPLRADRTACRSREPLSEASYDPEQPAEGHQLGR
ncbi:MAG: hypothetical protein H0W16_00245 [Actinobacteria bacterium]|nr:hypothetical protein [Actinomycetota bacterium]